ncbi:hypothetical protein SAMN02745885_01642 [Carboxydocella sporoproducens DSM 16521]|uniref:Uncharacterized protein n=2 Tax=Carboxydocella TaxID=178898 RepID=A0A1T4QF65_9FIRM|nr:MULTISPECIES: hypothetical protein [Carboxydocella]AVX21609.1 hypothetical protein CFE_2466 [Carboxydocella thermautotrophica]AVX31815.1 hypothetical protein CTH_2272 [Carboxydocella thermautotrophica]SKA02237.1 hypothetical protein SAMN02745885_01642 [Carboxydocella sporoproducens DSM 16521]
MTEKEKIINYLKSVGEAKTIQQISKDTGIKQIVILSILNELPRDIIAIEVEPLNGNNTSVKYRYKN